jgi:hypothetical protein
MNFTNNTQINFFRLASIPAASIIAYVDAVCVPEQKMGMTKSLWSKNHSIWIPELSSFNVVDRFVVDIKSSFRRVGCGFGGLSEGWSL